MAETLNRTLNLPQLTLYGVGAMIGAGIYSVVGAATGEAGYLLWVSFLLAGLAAFITVMSYAEMASTLPKAGAEYQYLKAAFPKWRLISFMAGYLIALNASATSATVSLAFAGYLNEFIESPKILVAFLVLVVCTVINIIGIKQSVWTSVIIMAIGVIGLILLIGAGFIYGEPGRVFTESFSSSGGNGFIGIFAATALIFFIFIGFEDVANLSEETKNPKKNTPRALLLCVAITSVIYIVFSIALLALVTPDEIADSESPLTIAAGKVSDNLSNILGGAALFATSSTALISLISISRMLFGMARDNYMPKILSKTLPVRKTPWIAALVLFVAASLFLPLGEVKIVASISSLGVLLVFMAVQIGVIWMRFTKPDITRPFRVPFAIGKIPILPVIGIIIIMGLLTQFEPVVYMVAVGAITFGVIVYFVRSAKF